MLSFRLLCRLSCAFLISAGVGLGGSPFVYAQQEGDGGGRLNPIQEERSPVQRQIERLRKQGQPTAARRLERRLNRQRATTPGLGAKDLSNYTQFGRTQALTPNDNPNPELNFDIVGSPVRAGDVNGDGVNDYLYNTMYGTPPRDERTSELSDRTGKTALFFGGDTPPETPDQLLYSALSPVGDLNGDGRSDAVQLDGSTLRFFEGTTGGYASSGVTVAADSLQPIILGFTDLDGDGYGDVLLVDNGESSFQVVYGGATFGDATLRTYSAASQAETFRYNAADLDGTGSGAVVRLAERGVDDRVQVFEIDADTRSLTRAQDFVSEEIQVFNSTIKLVDINGNGKRNLFVTRSNQPAYVFSRSSGEFNQTPVTFQKDDATPIGDLDADGNHDFYVFDESTGTRYVAYGPDNLSNGLSFDTEISYSEKVLGAPSFLSAYGGLGDVTGDGTDDAVLGYFAYTEKPFEIGRRFVRGQADRTVDLTTVSYPRRHIYDRVGATANVGDVNDDGTDDFAAVFLDRGKVGIYFGGQTIGDTPDRFLTIDGGTFPVDVAGGDFNGDGVSDVVVPFDGGGVSGTSKLAVFHGGASFDGTADEILSFADAAPSSYATDDGFQYVANAGDVNDDGVTDLIASAPYNTDSNGDYLNQAYLYYGGSSLSSTPSVTIDYSDSLGTEFLGRMQVTGLGDFNDDGVDDFAIGLNQASTPTNTDGKVHVFYGNSSSSFDGADLTLIPEAREQEGYYANGYSIAGGQDVNGDGVPDLVLLSAIVNTAGGSGTAYPVSAYYGNGESVEDDFAQEADRTNARWRVPVDALGPTASVDDVDGDGAVDLNFGALSLADLNQDGASEIVLGTGNYTNTNAVVFRGGAGGLRDDVKGPYAVYSAPNSDAMYGGRYGLATGDVTGNGRVDAVFAQRLDNNDAAGSARLYRHEGPESGLFGPEQLVAREEGASLDIRDHADLDGDGDQDVIVEAYLGSTADDQPRVELRWYENDGTGSFPNHNVLVEPQSEFFDDVEIVDLTGDGDPDLLWGTGEQIVWKKNQGNGTFGEARQINITTGASRLAVGDLNGDNSLDVVAEQENGLVWYSNETGASDADADGFGGATSIRAFDKRIEQLRLADLSGDGRLDVALLLGGGQGERDELLLFVNQGDESFDGRRIDTRSEDTDEALRTTDLDRDGDLDLLTADESISWYENQGDGFSERRVIQAASSEGQSWYAEAADLDADGTLDLVSSELGDGRLEYRDGNGTAQFGDAQLISRATVAPFDPTPTDLDGDGDYDLLVPTDFDNSPAWYENTKTTVPTSPQELAAARADGGVELDWSGSAAGYHVYRARRPFYNPVHAIRVTDDPVSATSFTDAGVAIDRRYYYRVTAVDGGESAPSDQATGTFSRPTRLGVDVGRTFGDASGSSDYRLVALPGQVDRSLSDAISGEAGVDWQAYWDDGSSNGYLIEHDGSDTFDFRAGRGFWLTATQSWTVTDSVETVSLGEDRAVSISLHDGWNIISNPLGIDVAWSAVSQANGGGLEPAWYFNGSFGQADSIWTAATGQAYYFLNDQGLDSLTVPYGSSGQASLASSKDEPSNRSIFRLRATAALKDTVHSVVRLGAATGARAGLDSFDAVAPPSRFSALSLRSQAPAEEGITERRHRLATDLRAAENPNHIYDLRLHAEPGTDVTLAARGLDSVEGSSVALVDPTTGVSHNLRRNGAVTVTLKDSSRGLRVAFGQRGFVKQKTDAVVPDEVELTPAPNPVRTQTTIRYTVPEAAQVRLEIYDILGRKVATLERARKQAGRHRVQWKVKNLTSGVYFGRLRVGKQTVTRKLTIVR